MDALPASEVQSKIAKMLGLILRKYREPEPI